MRQYATEFVIATRGKGLVEFTEEVVAWVGGCRVTTGLLTLHVRHTSASLVVQENADPDVRHDLERFFSRLVVDGDPMFVHRSEGPDDMSAHVRTALTATSLSIPVVEGAPALGTWQGIYLFEHRKGARRRRIAAHLIGD